ncbi:MAG TPA: hypothetical protein VFB13_21525 [Reyranella sp.]|jgi:hypothetical protein|nr:hypothetical protein [Reyranella sp.]
MKSHLHHANCGCLQFAPRDVSRRGMFGLAAGGALLAAFPKIASAEGYEAMLFNCIDPRFSTSSWTYMAGRGFKDLYSQFVIAGGPIGAVADVFKDWHKTFWDNLAITVQLHSIKRVIGLTHRDCGAAVVAYGDRIKKDWAFETEKHTEALRAFRAEIGKRQPKLLVDTGIMKLDGSVEVVT